MGRGGSRRTWDSYGSRDPVWSFGFRSVRYDVRELIPDMSEGMIKEYCVMRSARKGLASSLRGSALFSLQHSFKLSFIKRAIVPPFLVLVDCD